jgi:hypothetical protein
MLYAMENSQSKAKGTRNVSGETKLVKFSVA